MKSEDENHEPDAVRLCGFVRSGVLCECSDGADRDRDDLGVDHR